MNPRGNLLRDLQKRAWKALFCLKKDQSRYCISAPM